MLNTLLASHSQDIWTSLALGFGTGYLFAAIPLTKKLKKYILLQLIGKEHHDILEVDYLIFAVIYIIFLLAGSALIMGFFYILGNLIRNL